MREQCNDHGDCDCSGSTSNVGKSSSATRARRGSAPKPLPAPTSDFYQLVDVLTAGERMIVDKVRTFMGTKVQPIIKRYGSDAAFPFELLPSIKELQLGGLGYQRYGCAGGR